MKIRNILWWLGGVLILMSLVVLVSVLRSRHELNAYQAALMQRGEIFDLGKLVPPAAPKTDNGAGEILSAAEALRAEATARGSLPPTIGRAVAPVPGEAFVVHRMPEVKQVGKQATWEEFRNQMARFRPHLERIRAAARAQHLDIDPDYSLGPKMPLTFLTPPLFAARTLAQENLLFLHDSRVSEAVANVETILLLARMMAKEPLLICQLVALSIVETASIATWEILAAQPSAADLAQMASAWASVDVSDNLESTLRVERAWGSMAFSETFSSIKTAQKAMAALLPGGPPKPLTEQLLEDAFFAGGFGIWTIFFRHADEKQFLEYYQMLLDSRSNDEDWNTLTQKSAAATEALESSGLSRFCSRSLASTLYHNLQAFARMDTLQKLTLVAIAIERYRRDQGRLPASLDALVPSYLAAVPLDIMDRQPIRYRIAGPSYRLYGLGANGVDDKGDPSPPPGQTLPRTIFDRLDIVWPQAAP